MQKQKNWILLGACTGGTPPGSTNDGEILGTKNNYVASMTMPVLKTTVNATPILGPVLSGWSCFYDHACIENNSKCLVLNQWDFQQMTV